MKPINETANNYYSARAERNTDSNIRLSEKLQALETDFVKQKTKKENNRTCMKSWCFRHVLSVYNNYGDDYYLIKNLFSK